MDPLSISTGIAGLVGLGIQIGPAIHDYIATARKAEQDISWYADEVDALIEVCVCLDDFIKADAASQRNHFRTTDSVLGRTVTSCDASLRKLGTLLAVPVDWTQKLNTVLSNTPKDVEDLLKLQVEASQKLHEITKDIDALSVNAEKYRSTAENMSSMLEGIQSLREASDQLSSIQRDVGSIKRQLTDTYDMEILEWLSPEHGRGRHSEVRSRRTPGTGKWLADTSSFQNWLDKESSQRILWLVGDPGCGKSTLLSFVVDELKESHTEDESAIAYHYCDYRVQDTHPLVAALGAILRLLLERKKIIPPMLRDTFEKSRHEGRKPFPSELKEILFSVTASFEDCFILIDAMDEFSISDTTHLPQFIHTLDELATSGVNILVTSRAPPSPPLKCKHIVKTIHANETDISSYVAHALHTDDSLVDILDKTLERDISQTVVEQAKGMFLLAVLHLQNIRGQVTRSGVRKALKTLSGGLSDAYKKTFECIQHQSQARQKLAFDSLMWVSASYRPLKSLELQHALATQPDDEKWDPENIPSLRLIIRSCCGLLAVDDLDNSASDVRLVHNTLHHYLYSCQPEWDRRANQLITQTSLTYLHFASEQSQHSTNDNSAKSRKSPRQKLILTPFARNNWGHHAKRLNPSIYEKQALTLLSNRSHLNIIYPRSPRITGLHITATFGLTTLLTTLLSQKPQSQPRNNRDTLEDSSASAGAALCKACKYNHIDCASILLSHGARPDPPAVSITPLYTCVSNQNIALVTLLLDSGADPDRSCADGWTALHKAADDGSLEIVRLLVQRGASLSRSSARGLTALHRAAGRGHVDVIETLLAHGARVCCKSSDGWTPLHGAASAGRTEVVSFLIEYHEMHSGGGGSRPDDDFEEIQNLADIAGGVNFRTKKGWTPLHLACQGAHADTVEALLSAGASVGVADKEGDLPLHIAAREGNAGIMEVLLRGVERRAGQLECKNLKGWTPLQEAQLSGIYEAEQMLWRLSGLSLESVHGDSDSDSDSRPGLVYSDAAIRAEKLIKAIRVDDVEAVSGLLGLSDGGVVHEHQALEARNQGGRSPLQQALLFGSLKVARMLLVSGASVHARSDPGQWFAIHYAALSGNAGAVELCLSNGADVHAQTQQGQTPLHHACRRGSEDTVRLLLDQGARADAVDDRDWMPVQVAAAGGHERVVRLLLKDGEKDKTARFLSIESIQSCAAQGGHHGLVELTRKWRYSWLT
ncbi:hypothetical protein N7481_007231 [Penicillium waksmanii]|uniref:uncharacterized protein n=1 Tax=Penicillium waksmanii TaxID=69791 RepID=UPI0025469DAF|nr:uncharacterized protein N7481_007231 [Penicillium waksmanii]KAJ5979933.1 hypothetical protein N7481_007231 [Penicillium waksmanii]